MPTEYEIALAKLEPLRGELLSIVMNKRGPYFDPATYLSLFERFEKIRRIVVANHPDVFDEYAEPIRAAVIEGSDFGGRGYIKFEDLLKLSKAAGNILRLVESLGLTGGNQAHNRQGGKIFITHGRSPVWREVEAFVQKRLGLETLELSHEPYRGRTTIRKLDEESDKCCYAVIVMTGDDPVGDEARARENVVHEIGYFQGKFGLDRVCIIYERDTNLFSNIHGLGRAEFANGHVEEAFVALQEELKAAGLVTVTKSSQ